MTTFSSALPSRLIGDGSSARAYCGPAHGRYWSASTDGVPPERVELDSESGWVSYQLVHDARTARPAHDRSGSLVYMPQSYGNAPSATGPMPSAAQPCLPATPIRVPRPALTVRH